MMLTIYITLTFNLTYNMSKHIENCGKWYSYYHKYRQFAMSVIQYNRLNKTHIRDYITLYIMSVPGILFVSLDIIHCHLLNTFLCRHSAAWAYAYARTTSPPKLQGLETCCFFKQIPYLSRMKNCSRHANLSVCVFATDITRGVPPPKV